MPKLLSFIFRAAILEQYPALAGTIDELLPKKTQLIIAKW
jgi:hypothetical protein